jgi:hypothetical protein
MIIFSCFLSVVGGLDQTCRDEQFDIKIFPICSADRERCRSNRFMVFCGCGWCGEGVEEGEFFVDGALWIFKVGDFDRLCGMLCEKVKHCQKKPPAFALFMILL